jgi:multicomponent Na+:H+ antiporter subunit F
MIDAVDRALTLFLMLPLALAVYRMIAGPTFVDRIVALDMLTGLAVAIAALTAAATGRREFLDVGFGLALISFVGTCAFAAFVERKGRPS